MDDYIKYMKNSSDKLEKKRWKKIYWLQKIKNVFKYLIFLSILEPGIALSQNTTQENTQKNIQKKEIIDSHDTDSLQEHEKNLHINADSLDINKLRDVMVEEINREREKAWLEALVLNPILNKVAQNHAEYMDKNNRYNHKDKEGITSKVKVHQENYDKLFRWENIHNGPRNVFYVMKDRMESSMHANNILWVYTEEVGVGYCNGYRVLIFGWRMPWDRK